MAGWFQRLLRKEKEEPQAPVPQADALTEEEQEKTDRMDRLTPKELEVFRHLMEGNTLKETALLMGIKYPTVNTHVTAVYRKLGVNSRAQLILQYHFYIEKNRSRTAENT